MPMEDPKSFIFDHFLDALLNHGLASRMTKRARERLAGAGLDLSQPLLPAYPRSQWTTFNTILVEELFPGSTRDQALEQIGRATVEGYRHTTLGQAILARVKRGDPLRALQRLPNVLRGLRTRSESRITSLGERECEVWIGDSATPTFMMGVLEGLLAYAGVVEPRVELVHQEGRDITLRATWTGLA